MQLQDRKNTVLIGSLSPWQGADVISLKISYVYLYITNSKTWKVEFH